jgi:hypothetical protein
MEWTPSSPATCEFEIRMRPTGGNTVAEAITESVTLRAVTNLDGPALQCGASGVFFLQVPPDTGLVAVQPNAFFNCSPLLEYKVIARKAGSNAAWPTLHDWSRERVFYWRPTTLTPTEFQILYRRQGSNMPFEGATATAIYRPPVLAP